MVNFAVHIAAAGHGHGILELCVTEMYFPRQPMQMKWLQYAVVRHCSVSKQTEHSASSRVGRFRLGLDFFDFGPLRNGLSSLEKEVVIVVSMMGAFEIYTLWTCDPSGSRELRYLGLRFGAWAGTKLRAEMEAVNQRQGENSDC
jgi:hypothetical protein